MVMLVHEVLLALGGQAYSSVHNCPSLSLAPWQGKPTHVPLHLDHPLSHCMALTADCPRGLCYDELYDSGTHTIVVSETVTSLPV